MPTQYEREQEQRRERIADLYRQMPGAPVVRGSSHDDDQDNDHWRFCESVYDLIEAQIEAALTRLRVTR